MVRNVKLNISPNPTGLLYKASFREQDASNCGPTFPFSLTKSGNGNGTVSGTVNGGPSSTFCDANHCDPSKEQSTFNQSYASGTVITLTANPDGSSNFNGTWSGACSGTAPCTLTITGPTTVNAHFAANTTGGGSNTGGGCSGNCGGSITSGGGTTSGGNTTTGGQVLGTSTTSSNLQFPQGQVLGETTTLPRTGMPVGFIFLTLAAMAALLDKKLKLV